MLQLREQCSFVARELRPPSLSPQLTPPLTLNREVAQRENNPMLDDKRDNGISEWSSGPTHRSPAVQDAKQTR